MTLNLNRRSRKNVSCVSSVCKPRSRSKRFPAYTDKRVKLLLAGTREGFSFASPRTPATPSEAT
ncbi:hypothetical protein E2C01_088591 [Portunus trituberculatus]|uniref:Uncharacterized protein n=1 Tax=Portunus trituberculatus TaxID=210409 RepID=A0A5B7JGF5_PORTR|nr:hypothetical protein [Portunus trituberculatus]